MIQSGKPGKRFSEELMIGSDFLKRRMGEGVFQEVRQYRKRPCVGACRVQGTERRLGELLCREPSKGIHDETREAGRGHVLEGQLFHPYLRVNRKQLKGPKLLLFLLPLKIHLTIVFI